jgi:sec-independent protein translocase protein TatB
MVTPPTIEVANLGMADSLILMVMALVVFGPRRLPQIGRQIGKLMYEFRKASNDFKFQMEEELRNAEEADRRKKEEERLRALAATQPQPALTTDAGIAPEAENANPSPYPDESDYPAVIMPAEQTPAEETYPKIQPPSTGVQVPAARPWSMEEELAKGVGAEAGVEAIAGTGEPAPVSDTNQPASAAKTEEPEQAAHHG